MKRSRVKVCVRDVDNRKNLSYVRHTLRVSVSVNDIRASLHPDLVESKGLEKRASQQAVT